MIAAAALAVAVLAAPPRPARAPADPLRDALDLVYDGQTDTALTRLAALAAEAPDDPRPAYVHALALAWKVEQHPRPTPLDDELRRRAELVIALADARLERAPRDARAVFHRGAGHGLLARFHLFRLHRADAARESVKMRADLLRARELDPSDPETAFGLGLYDYYADVLPRAARLLRFLAGMPGGDRARGLAAIERARESAPLHAVEAQSQLYEIHAFYEDRPDRALAEVRGLARRYPRAPLWPLKMAEHLRARLGAFDESAQVARDILAAGRRHEGFRSPHVVALAHLALGEALLLDLRPGEARQALLPAREGVPGAPELRAHAQYLLGRAFEMDGDAEAAAVHYRAAIAAGDTPWREAASDALDDPLPGARVQALRRLAEARRHAEAGRAAEAAAAYAAVRALWPESAEAALARADAALGDGDLDAARRALPRLRDDDVEAAPWLRTWRWLLEAELQDITGKRREAITLYRRALHHADGHPALRSRAERGLREPVGAAAPRPSPTPGRNERAREKG